MVFRVIERGEVIWNISFNGLVDCSYAFLIDLGIVVCLGMMILRGSNARG
jgi:hypothetical protein